MKKRTGKRHSAQQIIKKLQEANIHLAAGKTIGEICRKLEISEPTYHRWQAKFGGMQPEEAKRLADLEDENKRLKKLLAESELEKDVLKTFNTLLKKAQRPE